MCLTTSSERKQIAMFPVSCSQFLFPKITHSPRSAREQSVIYWRLQRAAEGYVGPANNRLKPPRDVSLAPQMFHGGGRGVVSLPSFILLSAFLVLSILPFHHRVLTSPAPGAKLKIRFHVTAQFCSALVLS